MGTFYILEVLGNWRSRLGEYRTGFPYLPSAKFFKLTFFSLDSQFGPSQDVGIQVDSSPSVQINNSVFSEMQRPLLINNVGSATIALRCV
jgi:hypothetical protein